MIACAFVAISIRISTPCLFILRSTPHADSASSCHLVSSRPCMPVFIPPAASTCQLFMGLASPNGPWRTACQPFGLLCEGGTAWEAFEFAVDRTLVHRWQWSQLAWLYSLTRHGNLSLQSPFCFLLMITRVGQVRLTHDLNTGRNTGKDYWGIQQLSCPILWEEHLRIQTLTFPLLGQRAPCVRRQTWKTAELSL